MLFSLILVSRFPRNRLPSEIQRPNSRVTDVRFGAVYTRETNHGFDRPKSRTYRIYVPKNLGDGLANSSLRKNSAFSITWWLTHL